MDLGYDIFRKLDNGSVVWVKDVATLDEAKGILRALSSGKPLCEYFIRDAATGKILAGAELGNFGESRA